MIIVYGNYGLTFAITSTHANAAFVALPNGALMVGGRTGEGNTLTWDSGTQTSATTVTITATCTSAYDNPAALGVIGIANVQGLPVGTPVTVTPLGGTAITQNLVAGERGELSAWFVVGQRANSFTVTFTNINAPGGGSIASAAPFYIGEIYVGRAVQMNTLLDTTYPTSTLTDPTAFARSNGGQLWQNMRKPYRQLSIQLGRFTTLQCRGGSLSNLLSGDLNAGVMDLNFLRSTLSTINVCAVCDAPSAGFRQGSVVLQNGIYFDKNAMQPNWMLARPTDPGLFQLDAYPFWTWQPAFQEAT
jgi:hypothetical protein